MNPAPDTHLTPLVTRVVTAVLDDLAGRTPGAPAPSEPAISQTQEVSRTTVRSALDHLESLGIIQMKGRTRLLARPVAKSDYPAPVPQEAPKDQVARRYLLDAVTEGRIRPGDTIGERSVARTLGCSTAPVREAFIALSTLGLFRKDNNRQWRAVALDARQARELSELRELLECHGLRKLLESPATDRPLARLHELRKITAALAASASPSFERIIDTDIALHHLILEASGNRLIVERHRFIYAIIEFQLRNPRFTPARGKLGLQQHLRIIDAILAEDLPTAQQALREHLETALETLLLLRGKKSKNS